MDKQKLLNEITIIFLASIILSISTTFFNLSNFLITLIYFIIIIGSNFLIKKLVAYYYESDINLKFWSLQNYGLKAKAHFKKPLMMLWLPLLLAPLNWKWFAILETEIIAKTERVSKRHGLYRFSAITEWHIALITGAGIILNILLSIIGYSFNLEIFSKLSIYYAAWSIIPLSNLDGSKILFGNRTLWLFLTIIIFITLSWGIVIF